MEIELPKVPLEAGLGPENPPCPVCGEPLFPWLELPGDRRVAHRCEACELGLVGPFIGTDGALADLDLLTDASGAVTFPNRHSLTASFTGGGWSELLGEPNCRFTPAAIRELAAGRDQVLGRLRWRPVRATVSAWQSTVNLFTFGHNLALGLFGRMPARPASKPWQRVLDAFITVVVAIPAVPVAILIEALGAAFGRGGTYRGELVAP